MSNEARKMKSIMSAYLLIKSQQMSDAEVVLYSPLFDDYTVADVDAACHRASIECRFINPHEIISRIPGALSFPDSHIAYLEACKNIGVSNPVYSHDAITIAVGYIGKQTLSNKPESASKPLFLKCYAKACEDFKNGVKAAEVPMLEMKEPDQNIVCYLRLRESSETEAEEFKALLKKSGVDLVIEGENISVVNFEPEMPVGKNIGRLMFENSPYSVILDPVINANPTESQIEEKANNKGYIDDPETPLELPTACEDNKGHYYQVSINSTRAIFRDSFLYQGDIIKSDGLNWVVTRYGMAS